MRIGLRQANQRFSETIKAVKAGVEVVLTERGNPIAVIKPIGKAAKGEAALRRMEAAGLLWRATKSRPMRAFKPLRIKGKPLSATIRDERDSD